MYQWPKVTPVLTDVQTRAREEFMIRWHKVLPKKYGIIERFNHVGAFTEILKPGIRTLEIGAGFGQRISKSKTCHPADLRVANELRSEMAEEIKKRFPKVDVLIGDVQAGLPCESASFDRVLAVHVLEHLPKLPEALVEIRRVLKQDGFFPSRDSVPKAAWPTRSPGTSRRAAYL